MMDDRCHYLKMNDVIEMKIGTGRALRYFQLVYASCELRPRLLRIGSIASSVVR